MDFVSLERCRMWGVNEIGPDPGIRHLIQFLTLKVSQNYR